MRATAGLILALLLAGTPALASTVLTITEHHHRETPKGMTREKGAKPPEPTDSTQTVTLILADTSVEADTAENRFILDFSSRRAIEVDPKAGAYSDHSLFCLLGFSVLEFQNRLMINRVLAAGNLKLPSGPVMVEQLFGFEAPDAHSKVDSHHDRSATEWRADRVLLARASDALMPAEQSPSWLCSTSRSLKLVWCNLFIDSSAGDRV